MLGISRYGIVLSEASITSNTTFEFEQLFTKSQVIVIVVDDPEVQLTAQVHESKDTGGKGEKIERGGEGDRASKFNNRL